VSDPTFQPYEVHVERRSPLIMPGSSGGYILHADRSPCPVCGHPTGDCKGDLPKPARLAGMSDKLETLKHAQTVYVEEDIHEEIQITPGRTTKILKHPAGSQISYEDAEKLGLI